ncbi:MAG TPA: sugar transferase [Candidatus Chromulinivoraceae bacterium]|nr:sugar transferase [Candidatus Chromulinivoraceae bacterium]
MYRNFLKRTFDLISALFLLSFLFIPFTIIAAWIKLDSRGPVLFKQKRAGKDLKPFTVYKFRTMETWAPRNVATRNLRDSGTYITRSGKIMRKISVDELPQLFNVLRGEMSIVGPRPVVLQEQDLFAEREKYGANACRPGITGWAQVNGRDEVRTAEKAKLDGIYAASFGFVIDAKCLLKTISAVFLTRGHREGYEFDDDGSDSMHLERELTPGGELDEGVVV